MKKNILVIFFVGFILLLVFMAIALDTYEEDEPIVGSSAVTDTIYELPFNWTWDYRQEFVGSFDSFKVGDTITVMYEKFLINKHDSTRVKYVKADTSYYKFFVTVKDSDVMYYQSYFPKKEEE